MTDYISLEKLVIDSMLSLSEWKEPLISCFLRPRKYGSSGEFSADVIITKELPKNMIERWQKEEPEFYAEMYEFSEFLNRYWKQKLLKAFYFNKIFSLASLLPELCNWMKENSADVPQFSASKKFLKHATASEVPLRYFCFLATILVVENAEWHLRTIDDPRQRERQKMELEAMTKLFHLSFKELFPVARAISVKTSLDKGMQCTYRDVYIFNGKPQPIRFFDETGDAKMISILGWKGCGKTTALMRILYSAWKQGYLCIVLGEDERGEFRYATQGIEKRTREAVWKTLKEHGEQSEGLPVTIYTKKPQYPCEKPVKGFNDDWDNLEGIVLFEHDLPRIMKSFTKWRKVSRKRRVVLGLNEAQNFIGSVVSSGDEWKLFHDAGKLFINLRGFFVPTIVSTQLMSALGTKAKSSDELFISWIDLDRERKEVSKNVRISQLGGYISAQGLKDKKEFYHVTHGKFRKIKFLVPPCMPENEHKSLNDIFK